MSVKFTQSFKIQAVEKALNRADDVTQEEVATILGVGKSTLSKWIAQSRNNALESNTTDERLATNHSSKEKRPQDWNQEERLNIIMECHSLDEKAINEHCRTQGIYPHHLTQWKQAFMSTTPDNKTTHQATEIKQLKTENKALKKELHRKEKALAETAALLVLKKKVQAIWGSNEDSSR